MAADATNIKPSISMKSYIKPIMDIEDATCRSLVAASLTVNDDNASEQNKTAESTGRRGGWGDLWDGK